MDTLKESLAAIENKLQLLQFTNDDVKKTLEKGHLPTMERKRKTLRSKLDEVHELEVQVQESKIGQGEDRDAIREWTAKIEDKVTVYEHSILKLDEAIGELNQTEIKRQKQEEQKLATQLRQVQFEQEMQFEEAKLEQKLRYEKKAQESLKKQEKETKNNTKLPKLVISKFNGTPTDWLRFWSQFETEIDTTDISKVTKFSYLKELLEPKVRVTVDGLPFNIEGYERAKNILKTKYGKPSEIINAYVQAILSLPTICGTQPLKIYEFYEKLVTSVQSLETLGKLKEVNGYVRATIDKLEGIRGDLVRTDDNWQEWEFPQLIEAMRKWTERNPVKSEDTKRERDQIEKKKHSHGRSFQTREQEWKVKPCVYCESDKHKSVNCDKLTTVADRKKKLSTKQLCFNCTGGKHKAAECRSKSSCQSCQKRHHTSICDQTSEQMLGVATSKGTVTYPVVIVKVGEVKCRALLDTGAGCSYASAALLDRLKKRPIRREPKRIEMMLHTVNRMTEVYDLEIHSLKGDFHLNTEVTKVDRAVLLSLKNPNYDDMMSEFPHLQGVSMNEVDTKPELPVHLILGASEYARIKMQTKPRVGKPGEPVAELTRLGWTIMSPGKEADLTDMFLTQTSTCDYEQLSRLDVLGLEDRPPGDQKSVYEEFKEQLVRSPEGWYETGLPWKANHPPLPNNEQVSIKRLGSLVKKLQSQPDLLKKYDDIIQDQLDQGIVERVPASNLPNNEKEFYIPHKPVIRETAESTKIRIVYDASSRAHEKAPSLNDCLETGPPLQNLLWRVLIRNRFYPVAITGDLKQAFLQVRIKEEDKDVMRFHWLKDKTTKEIETLRFTRALFGLAPSPFLLGGVIEQHLESSKSKSPKVVQEIKESLYVDDLIGGAETMTEAQHLKESARSIFNDAHFQLHKWHSNEPTLEIDSQQTREHEQISFAKEQLGVKSGETKLLGLTWDKTKDTIEVAFPTQPAESTKRGILRKIARIYDPLGLVSPVTLAGKVLFREACDTRIGWDKPLPSDLKAKWNRWEQRLPTKVEIPRSLTACREEIEAVDLHVFGDASARGVSAAAYAVVYQSSGTSQGLIASKSRLSKKELTIPRLELVSGHMSANLLHNIRETLQHLPIRQAYGWLDSSVELHQMEACSNSTESSRRG